MAIQPHGRLRGVGGAGPRMSAVGWMARRRTAGRRTLRLDSGRPRPGRADRSLRGSLARTSAFLLRGCRGPRATWRGDARTVSAAYARVRLSSSCRWHELEPSQGRGLRSLIACRSASMASLSLSCRSRVVSTVLCRSMLLSSVRSRSMFRSSVLCRSAFLSSARCSSIVRSRLLCASLGEGARSACRVRAPARVASASALRADALLSASLARAAWDRARYACDSACVAFSAACFSVLVLRGLACEGVSPLLTLLEQRDQLCCVVPTPVEQDRGEREPPDHAEDAEDERSPSPAPPLVVFGSFNLVAALSTPVVAPRGRTSAASVLGLLDLVRRPIDVFV